MKLYPVFANLENKLSVIIGGGKVALRKLNDLMDSGAKVKIIAPEISDKIIDRQKQNPDKIELLLREYKKGDLKDAVLAFTATGNAAVNNEVYQEAEEKNILMNSADDPDNCSFFVPSMARKGDLVIAVSSGGTSPAMAAKLRRLLEKSIPSNIEDILNALHEARKILKNMGNLDQAQRGDILKTIINDDELLEELIMHDKNDSIKDMIDKLSQAS